jgi:hypothetical protein
MMNFETPPTVRMQRTHWIERRFVFNFPEGWMPNILARLAGAPLRLAALTEPLSPVRLTHKPGGKWSIQEHVGHLVDLEGLHDGRINDFILRKPVLRAADMRNAKTNAAFHNQRELGDLLEAFRQARENFIARLELLDDKTQRFRSRHPRLRVPMRPCDMAYFTAEHDDHHIATIIGLLAGR